MNLVKGSKGIFKCRSRAGENLDTATTTEKIIRKFILALTLQKVRTLGPKAETIPLLPSAALAAENLALAIAFCNSSPLMLPASFRAATAALPAALTSSVVAPWMSKPKRDASEYGKRTVWTEELAGMLAKELLKEKAGEEGSGGIVVYKHRTDDTPNALGFLTAITTAFTNEVSTLTSPPSYLMALSSSPSSQSATSTSVVLLFGSDEKKVKEVGDALRSKLSVKGGGKGQKWSGKFMGVWLDNREGSSVRGLLGL